MPFTFDKKTRTYFKDGRPVKPETLRQWVSEVLERTREQMHGVTQEFVEGGINRPAWMLQMKQLVSRSHGAMAMLAQGGRDAMDEKSWGRAGQRIKSEVEYLRGFERSIANGQAGTDAQILVRGARYADALHATYIAAVVAREKAAGVAKVLRVLDPSSNNCRDCPSLAGEYDIDAVPAIGDSECSSACRCDIVSLEGVAA